MLLDDEQSKPLKQQQPDSGMPYQTVKPLPPTQPTKATETTTAKASKAQEPKNRQGQNNPFYGKQHSDETKKKMSDTQRLRYQQLVKNALTEEKIESVIESVMKKYFP